MYPRTIRATPSRSREAEMKQRMTIAILMIGVMIPLVAAASTPLATVEVNVNKVLDVLRDPSLKGDAKKKLRQDRIRDISEKMFDFTELSRRTLAQNWNTLNDSQKKEFVDLYKAILEKAYIDKIMAYTDEKILFQKESSLGEKTSEVRTVVVTKKAEIPINYRVIRKDDGWWVYDVVVEGVSLVNNYRSQFREILINKTPDDLLEVLRKKAGKT
jgi:phospholipid transport system substrate-binding protein